MFLVTEIYYPNKTFLRLELYPLKTPNKILSMSAMCTTTMRFLIYFTAQIVKSMVNKIPYLWYFSCPLLRTLHKHGVDNRCHYFLHEYLGTF